MITRRHLTHIIICVVAVALSLAACGNDGRGGGGSGSASTVDVTLQEFAISTSETTAPAGDVTFDVSNKGPNDTHEFVVIKTDLGPTELPTDQTGAVDENGAGIEVVDEIEDIAVGQNPSLTVDLDPGSYVLICNIYDKKEHESHYQEGMRTSFTVE